MISLRRTFLCSPPARVCAQLTEELWGKSLEQALDAGPHHISTYDLQVAAWAQLGGARSSAHAGGGGGGGGGRGERCAEGGTSWNVLLLRQLGKLTPARPAGWFTCVCVCVCVL